MPNVIVDTNVLVRALLKPNSSDGLIIKGVIGGKYKLFFSLTLISELKEVLAYKRIRKFGVTNQNKEVFLKTLFTFGKVISVSNHINICRDPDDNELLSIAASIPQTDPVYLISADNDILVLKEQFEKIKIVTPQQFLKVKFA